MIEDDREAKEWFQHDGKHVEDPHPLGQTLEQTPHPEPII